MLGDGKKEDSNKGRYGTEDGQNVKDTLVFGRGGDSTSLDPSRVTEGESFKVTVNLYETLIELRRARYRQFIRGLQLSGNRVKMV